MKIRYILSALFCCCIIMNNGFSQEKSQRSENTRSRVEEQVCPTKGIITDYWNYVNPEVPAKVNDFFDWGSQNYDVNLSGVNHAGILSPFNSITAFNPDLDHIHESRDYLNEKGWELITLQLGIDENGGNFVNYSNFGFFVLYNKYSSTMRVLMNGYNKLESSPNQIAVTIDVYGSGPSDVTPSMLQDNNGFVGIKDHWSEQKMSSLQSFGSDLLNEWTYADFYINYDPCVCLHESKFKIRFDLVQNSQIDLIGSLSGVISTVTDANTGTSDPGFSLDFNDLVGAGTKAIKTYESIKDFKDKQLEIAELVDGSGNALSTLTTEQLKKFNEYNKFERSMAADFGTSSILRGALKAAPFIGTAMTLIDFFVGSPSSEETQIPPPQSIEAEVKLSGNIPLTNYVSETAYRVPGSKNIDPLADTYPYYNEVLGVFNILEVPKLRLKETRTTSAVNSLHNSGSTEDNIVGSPGDDLSSLQDMHVDYFCSSGASLYLNDYYQKYEFELDGNIEYFVNPSSGLETEDIDIMGAIVFERDRLSLRTDDIIAGCPSGGRFFNMFFSNGHGQGFVEFNKRTTETDMLPLGCLASNSFSFEEQMRHYRQICYEALSSPCSLGIDSVQYEYLTNFVNIQGVKKASLKLIVNLKRKDNGENVLHVVTYPMEIVYDNSVPNMSLMTSQPEIHKEIVNASHGDDVDANYVSTLNSDLNSSFVIGSSNQTSINGFGGIEIGPETSIANDVALYSGQPTGCYSIESKPYSQEDLVSFCKSGAYRGIRENSKRRREKSSSASIEVEEDYGSISIYPNPATNEINIGLDQGEGLSYIITDITGKTVMQGQKLNSGVNSVDISYLDKGIYLVSIRNIKGVAIMNKKIVKT